MILEDIENRIYEPLIVENNKKEENNVNNVNNVNNYDICVYTFAFIIALLIAALLLYLAIVYFSHF